LLAALPVLLAAFAFVLQVRHGACTLSRYVPHLTRASLLPTARSCAARPSCVTWS
jgi:hypothetical protein